jgi:nitroreductase
MDFLELIHNRHSVRSFSQRSVEAEKLQKILEAANSAPSAGNLQAYEIYVVTESAQKKALARAALGQDFVAAAPVVLVFCQNPTRSARKYRQRGESLYSLQDATVACTFAMLAVTELGLGTVWVGAFNDQAVSQALQLPETLRPVALLPIGHSAESPEVTPRRHLSDLVHYPETRDFKRT